MRLDAEEPPAAVAERFRMLGEHFHLEPELAAEFRLVRQVDVNVHAFELASPLRSLQMTRFRELAESGLDLLPNFRRTDDQVDVVADVAADPDESRPPADENGRLQLVPEVVEHKAEVSLVIEREINQFGPPPWPNRRPRTTGARVRAGIHWPAIPAGRTGRQRSGRDS